MILFNIVIFKKIVETTIYIATIETIIDFIIDVTIYDSTRLILVNIDVVVVAKSINAIITRRFQLTLIVK